MPQTTAHPQLSTQETKLRKVDGIVVYARTDQDGKPAALDAIDQDKDKIFAIADRLWHRGFGVMRARVPRAGKVFYLFKANWAGSGDPPDEPFEE